MSKKTLVETPHVGSGLDQAAAPCYRTNVGRGDEFLNLLIVRVINERCERIPVDM